MSIELTPVGVACNLQCTYCYQDQMREAGNVHVGWDFEKVKATLEREGSGFTVFGGEALLTPIDRLEEIFAYGLQRFGTNGIQTNGALITEAHVALFRKYKVHVGFSLDGPGELNDSRWAGTLEETRAATRRSFEGLDMVLRAKIPVSVIVTLYRGNAVGVRLERLVDWLRELEGKGIRHARIHLLEVENDDVRREMALTNDENTAALLVLYRFQAGSKLQLDLFGEMAKLLMGDDKGATCVWNACDPYTTVAVRGVNGRGELSNCGRTNKEGVDWQKAEKPGYERQLVLHRTPQAELGCQDCRFFFACKGHCPGTAEHGDWRNRSEHCATWMALFTKIEADLQDMGRTPLSVQPELRRATVAVMLEHWVRGQNVSIAGALGRARGGPEPIPQSDRAHGDHWDAPDGHQHSDAGFEVHGDNGTTVMHGDTHGDSNE